MSSAQSIHSIATETDAVITYNVESDNLHAAAMQLARMSRRKGIDFNMMIVGDSGLGKSTLIEYLFGPNSFSQSQQQPLRTKIDTSSSYLFCREVPDLTVRTAILTENNFDTRMTLVQAPGFGDYTDNTNSWVPLTHYIDNQYIRYMCQEEQPDRTQISDGRVHLCLYFLAPTLRVSELDIKSMLELGNRVNLIPIIAKADSFTRADLAEFKQLVRATILEHGIRIWVPPEEEEVEFEWPFAITAGNDEKVAADGQILRGRNYSWGFVDSADPQHSDTALFKRIVFEEHLLDIIDKMQTQFYDPIKHQSRVDRLEFALKPSQPPSTPGTGTGAGSGSGTGVVKLAPEDRPYINLTRNLSSASRLSAADAAAAVATGSISGLELAQALSRVGYKFLETDMPSASLMWAQGVTALKRQYDQAAKLQQERFDQRATSLELKKRELSNEINELSIAVRELEIEIKN